MKKTKATLVAAATALLTACGTMGQAGSGSSTTGSVLGAVLTDVLQGGTLGNVITSVIGAQKVTAADLVGSWKYNGILCHCGEKAFEKYDPYPCDTFEQLDSMMEHCYTTPGASHVGIYVGDGMMIHAGDPIKYSTINTRFYKEHFLCFGRLPFYDD